MSYPTAISHPRLFFSLLARGGLLVAVVLIVLGFAAVAQSAEDRETKVRNDRKEVEEDGNWIYNDLQLGFAEAKVSGKPLLVVFRCVPCEACAQLDAQVVNRDPAVRELLEKFVCVRVVHANGLDLSLFQYDYDQSFAAFMLNADKTIYGRYGTRSHQTESRDDVSVDGFAKALAGALELHQQYPANRAALAGKRGPKSEVAVPEEYPSLRGKYGSKLDYEGKVVASCIHCHQVGEAQRLVYRSAGKPIPDKVLYPWPLPNVLGLTLDPKETATVKSVARGSSAEKDGFRAGDAIVSLDGQPILSIADVQWLLHNAGESGSLRAEVRRGDKRLRLALTLPQGWRQKGDISWRATSWELRRMASGGLVLKDLSDEDRQKAGLKSDGMALRVDFVGQYGEHAAGKREGLAKGDIITEVDGNTDRWTESNYLANMINEKRRGDRIRIVILRDGKPIKLQLPVQ